MGRRYSAFLTLLLAAVAALFIGTTAHAQQAGSSATPSTSTTGNGLRVSPVRSDLTIEPGKSKVLDLYVENITDKPETLRGVANDFMPSDDETGKPRVLFDENAFAPRHGLKRYVAPISKFTLAPKERKNIKVTISIPKEAAGGGYYGTVRFLPTDAKSDKSVSLTASVGSLILVTVPGDVKLQVSLASFNISRGNGKASTLFTSGKDLKVSMRFKNTGNIQAAPFGKVNLKRSGKTLASYEINTTKPRGNVLPDSIRLYEQGFGDKATPIGKYTVEGNFGYGDKGELVSANTTFYVVPLLYIILAAGAVILIGLFAFIIPRMLKEHDRRLIKRMRGKS